MSKHEQKNFARLVNQPPSGKTISRERPPKPVEPGLAPSSLEEVRGQLRKQCGDRIGCSSAFSPPGQPSGESARTMRKTQSSSLSAISGDDLLPEYRLDYTTARPNRFAGQVSGGRMLVLLDPDVSEVFGTPESVNTALRTLIAAMPDVKKQERSQPRTSRQRKAR